LGLLIIVIQSYRLKYGTPVLALPILSLKVVYNRNMPRDPFRELCSRAQTLLDRLERISADSPWAHQASGVRASLARSINEPEPDLVVLDRLIRMGFEILEKAAAEILED
jgi:hypothetical protein